MLKTVSGYQLDSLVNQAKTGRNAVGALATSGKYDEVAGAAAAMRLSLPFL